MKKLRLFFVFIAFASQVAAQNAPGLPDTFWGNTFGASYSKVVIDMATKNITASDYAQNRSSVTYSKISLYGFTWGTMKMNYLDDKFRAIDFTQRFYDYNSGVNVYNAVKNKLTGMHGSGELLKNYVRIWHSKKILAVLSLKKETDGYYHCTLSYVEKEAFVSMFYAALGEMIKQMSCKEKEDMLIEIFKSGSDVASALLPQFITDDIIKNLLLEVL